MMDLKFTGTIWKAGNSFVVTVPLPFVKNLDIEKEYSFVIKEVEKNVTDQ